MAQKIVFKNPDGSCSILTPSPNWGGTMESLAEKDVPEGLDWRITDEINIPSDRTFRGAWTDDNPTDTVDIDISKAKLIREDQIRKERDDSWPDFDRRYFTAERDGADLTLLGLERQTLKDAPNDAASILVSANTVEAILNVTFSSITGL